MSFHNDHSSLADLISTMLKADSSGAIFPHDLIPLLVPRIWEGVRHRIKTHKFEVQATNVVVPVTENGFSSVGMLPLHAALCLKESLRAPCDILVQLVESFPPALCRQTDTGLAPLHLAVNLGDTKLVKFLLAACPDAAKLQSKAGLLPLHLAKSAEVASLLLQVHPDAVKIRDNCGNLPLHFATHYKTYSHDVVRLLLDKAIEEDVDGTNGAGGALQLNKQSYYPVKIATENSIQNLLEGGEFEALDNFWQKLRLCLWAVSKSRHYHFGSFLHICMSSLRDEKLLKFSLKQCTGDVFHADACGRHPLHIAAMNRNIPGSILRELINQNPAAVLSCDTDSKLPLHYAARSGRMFCDGLEDLVSASTLSLLVQGPKTNLYPFMMAAVGLESSVASIYGLLRAEPNALLNCFL